MKLPECWGLNGTPTGMMTTTTIKEFQSGRIGTPPKSVGGRPAPVVPLRPDTYTGRKNELEEQDPERQEGTGYAAQCLNQYPFLHIRRRTPVIPTAECTKTGILSKGNRDEHFNTLCAGKQQALLKKISPHIGGCKRSHPSLFSLPS